MAKFALPKSQRLRLFPRSERAVRDYSLHVSITQV